MLQLHPLEQIVNVQWTVNDFVIYGTFGPNVSSLERFLIYSKNGREWTKLPTAKLPPITGSSLRAMVYGSGAWLAISNQIVRSKDKFETWEVVTPFPSAFPTLDAICYGKPTTEAPNPPLDDEGEPIRKGVFVAIGSDNSEFKICSSRDQGKTWTINKTVSKDAFDYNPAFVTFANGKFFACAAGLDNNNGGFGSTFGPAAPVSCKLYTSEDGVTWDSGHEILSSLTSKTWGSELGFTSPSQFYVEVFPYGLVYKKKRKAVELGSTSDEAQEAKYVISGELFFANGRNLFYAESSSTSFSGIAIGDQALFQSPIGQHFDPETGDIINGGTNGEYYTVNVPSYRGGNIAAIKDSSIIAAQKYSQSESTVTYVHASEVGGIPGATTTEGYLVVSSDEEGVLTSSYSQNYFCGGTFSRAVETGVDQNDVPVIHNEAFSEAGPAQIAVNGRKQPDADEDSPGTFLWVRRFAFDTFNPETSAPISNRGIEVRTSPDGSNFTVRSTPISGKTVGTFAIVLGATPPPPTDDAA